MESAEHPDRPGDARRERSSRSRRPTVFVTRVIPEPGPSLLEECFDLRAGRQDRDIERPELLAGVVGVDAIVCTLRDRIDAEVLDAAGPLLRVVSNLAAGYDNIDVTAAAARRVVVTNTPGVLTDATADLAWALILAASRRVAEGDRMVRRGEFGGWSPTMLLGHDVAGKTLGIVGMGAIGRAVARRALGFDMRVFYTRRSGPLEPGLVPPGARWEYRQRLDDLLRASDFVSVHVPLTPETRHLIGSREFALMRPGAVLVNTARGPIVDEEALVRALAEGRPAAAGLDVYEQEPRVHPGLIALENVVLLPHLGSATVETRSLMAGLAARNAIAVIRGETPPHAVSAPTTTGRGGSGSE
jgi:glyoxylate reductase